MQFIYIVLAISLGVVVADEVTNKTTTECGENEEYKHCGTACPRTCHIGFPGECGDTCVKGCFCQWGYVRAHINGKCISSNNCKDYCRENELYHSCGTGCSDTCLHRDRNCVFVCFQGCFCHRGYVLDDTTQECIKKEECPVSRT